MSKRSRDRHLAKLAARRQAERRAAERRRSAILGSIAGVAGIALLVGAWFMFFADSPTPIKKASATPTVSPTPSASPGAKTGTVQVQPAPTKTACGAKPPSGAGKPKPQYAGPPPLTIDPKKTYVATFETSCGAFTIQLETGTSLQTTNSFVFLADKGFFDGQYFTRLDTSIDVVQGGDPTGTGTGGPGYSIPDEFTGTEKYTPGTFAMAHAQAANSGGSQFFLITGKKGAKLPAQYTIFGHVTSGLGVLTKIQQLPIKDPQGAPGDIAAQAPAQAIYIDKVTIAVKK